MKRTMRFLAMALLCVVTLAVTSSCGKEETTDTTDEPASTNDIFSGIYNPEKKLSAMIFEYGDEVVMAEYYVWENGKLVAVKQVDTVGMPLPCVEIDYDGDRMSQTRFVNGERVDKYIYEGDKLKYVDQYSGSVLQQRTEYSYTNARVSMAAINFQSSAKTEREFDHTTRIEFLYEWEGENIVSENLKEYYVYRETADDGTITTGSTTDTYLVLQQTFDNRHNPYAGCICLAYRNSGYLEVPCMAFCQNNIIKQFNGSDIHYSVEYTYDDDGWPLAATYTDNNGDIYTMRYEYR